MRPISTYTSYYPPDKLFSQRRVQQNDSTNIGSTAVPESWLISDSTSSFRVLGSCQDRCDFTRGLQISDELAAWKRQLGPRLDYVMASEVSAENSSVTCQKVAVISSSKGFEVSPLVACRCWARGETWWAILSVRPA